MADSAAHQSQGGQDQHRSNPKGGQQGIARDERGQDQPVDKDRAQRTSAQKAQKDAAESQPASPGQPAGGE